MVKWLYALTAGIIGAGIVHIATLLLIPAVSDIDTWTRLSAFGNLNEFHQIELTGSAAASIRALDPTFQVAACRFDLADGPVEIASPANRALLVAVDLQPARREHFLHQ